MFNITLCINTLDLDNGIDIKFLHTIFIGSVILFHIMFHTFNILIVGFEQMISVIYKNSLQSK